MRKIHHSRSLESESRCACTLSQKGLNRQDVDTDIAYAPFLGDEISGGNRCGKLLIFSGRAHRLGNQVFLRVALAGSGAGSVGDLETNPVTAQKRLCRDRSAGHDKSFL